MSVTSTLSSFAILLISALLTAGYLLPIVVEGFFPGEGFNAQFDVRAGKTVRDGKLVSFIVTAKKDIKTAIVYKDKIFDISMNEGNTGAFVIDQSFTDRR